MVVVLVYMLLVLVLVADRSALRRPGGGGKARNLR